MKNSTPIQTYIKQIQSLNPSHANEISYRTFLENLFTEINQTQEFKLKNLKIIHEASDKELDIEGTPDFFIYENYDQLFRSLVGFIECKKISYDLEKLIASEQIKKYSKTCENIIITNYKEFILLHKGAQKCRAKLLNCDLSENQNPNNQADFENLLREFYGFYQTQIIKNKKSLVLALARQSFYYSVVLREYVENLQSHEGENFHHKFSQLFKEFGQSVQYSYQLNDFCDIYSQSLVYGLLLVMLESQTTLNENPSEYLRQIPNNYRLLKEFLKSGYEEDYMPTAIKAALAQVGKNLNLINIESVEQEFAKNQDGKQSIAVYLYEDFLKNYDNLKKTENRKENGVYYTPKEVSRFIVKSVEHIIKEKFGKADGFLANEVKTLDFACGTGTFLEEVFNLIADKNADSLQKAKIKHKVLNDIYGFELLYTPYIVAHTILTKHLKDCGINIEAKNNENLGIYLTNTLDIAQHSISGLLPQMKKEHEKSTKIKNDENILAIIGNPPYFNGKSQSISPTINGLLNDYKKGLNEKKINLNDLYIKFIKFAQHKIDHFNKDKLGVVGIITNNSFLDGITHRKMRQSLLVSFDEIYVLNLHGNARKGESDKNIFDIMVGVSICFFVKLAKPQKTKEVFYFSSLENGLISRTQKLEFLANKTLSEISWTKLQPQKSKNFWFIKKDFGFEKEYEKFWKLNKIFNKFSSGVESGNDEHLIKYKQKDLEALRQDYQSLSAEKLRSIYQVEDKRNWQLAIAKKDITNNYNPRQIDYRVFDKRWTSLSKTSTQFLSWPRYEVMQNFENENLGICFEKNKINQNFQHVLVSQIPICRDLFCSATYLAPLYLYEEESKKDENAPQFFANKQTKKTVNFTAQFSQFLAELNFATTPESVLAYIYAVLHCGIYRAKYLEFLKSDFPAIPFCKNSQTFFTYAALGQKLIDLHLLKNLPNDPNLKVNFVEGLGEFVIAKITPPSVTSNLLILQTTQNQIIEFSGVDKTTYDLEIGSYKPIDKWLKYRINDQVFLDLEDISHLKNMIISLKNTAALMAEIKGLNAGYGEIIL